MQTYLAPNTKYLEEASHRREEYTTHWHMTIHDLNINHYKARAIQHLRYTIVC